MPVSPTGFLSVTADALARTVAASTTFQTVTGSANATEALTHIFYGMANDHIAAQVPPRCIIDFDTTETDQEGGIGSNGVLAALIQIPVGSSYVQSGTYAIDPTKWNDAWLDFMNKIGAIWRECDTLIKSGTYLSGFKISNGKCGLDHIAEDMENRKDENDSTLPGKDTWYFELLFSWRGG